MPESEALAGLLERGVIVGEGTCFRTTARWHAAMARAALRLSVEGSGDGRDLRVPVVLALLDFFRDASDGELSLLVDALLPIEIAEVEPRSAKAGRMT